MGHSCLSSYDCSTLPTAMDHKQTLINSQQQINQNQIQNQPQLMEIIYIFIYKRREIYKYTCFLCESCSSPRMRVVCCWLGRGCATESETYLTRKRRGWTMTLHSHLTLDVSIPQVIDWPSQQTFAFANTHSFDWFSLFFLPLRCWRCKHCFNNTIFNEESANCWDISRIAYLRRSHSGAEAGLCWTYTNLPYERVSHTQIYEEFRFSVQFYHRPDSTLTASRWTYFHNIYILCPTFWHNNHIECATHARMWNTTCNTTLESMRSK